MSRADSSSSFHTADSTFTAASRAVDLDEAVQATRLLVAELEARVRAGGAPEDSLGAHRDGNLFSANGEMKPGTGARVQGPAAPGAGAAASVASGARLAMAPPGKPCCSWRQALQEALADERLVAAAHAAVGGVGGAAALGTGGAAFGVAAGSVAGAICGLAPAVLTAGLSIPVGAALGGAGGLCVGATAGGAAGFLGGGAAGYYCFTCRRARRHGVAAEVAPGAGSSPRLFPGSGCIGCGRSDASPSPRIASAVLFAERDAGQQEANLVS